MLSHVCSNSRPTQLSQSQCNESDYTAQVFRMPMIVTSNNLSSGCDDTTAGDWIEKNSFYPWIDKPTWIQVEVAMSKSSAEDIAEVVGEAVPPTTALLSKQPGL